MTRRKKPLVGRDVKVLLGFIALLALITAFITHLSPPNAPLDKPLPAVSPVEMRLYALTKKIPRNIATFKAPGTVNYGVPAQASLAFSADDIQKSLTDIISKEGLSAKSTITVSNHVEKRLVSKAATITPAAGSWQVTADSPLHTIAALLASDTHIELTSLLFIHVNVDGKDGYYPIYSQTKYINVNYGAYESAIMFLQDNSTWVLIPLLVVCGLLSFYMILLIIRRLKKVDLPYKQNLQQGMGSIVSYLTGLTMAEIATNKGRRSSRTVRYGLCVIPILFLSSMFAWFGLADYIKSKPLEDHGQAITGRVTSIYYKKTKHANVPHIVYQFMTPKGELREGTAIDWSHHAGDEVVVIYNPENSVLNLPVEDLTRKINARVLWIGMMSFFLVIAVFLRGASVYARRYLRDKNEKSN